MRIIAGEKRGMVLYSPKDQKIRPTSDKIKGAIFSSIQNILTDADVFVDVFGGSGAMGIEALSRGVAEAWFFDVSIESIRLINKNIQKAGYQNRAHICHCPALDGFERMAKQGISCDIVFMDPPYIDAGNTIILAEQIQKKKLLKNDGILMIEHPKNDIMPKRINRLIKTKIKNYGITGISFFCFDGEEGIDEFADQ